MQGFNELIRAAKPELLFVLGKAATRGSLPLETIAKLLAVGKTVGVQEKVPTPFVGILPHSPL